MLISKFEGVILYVSSIKRVRFLGEFECYGGISLTSNQRFNNDDNVIRNPNAVEHYQTLDSASIQFPELLCCSQVI